MPIRQPSGSSGSALDGMLVSDQPHWTSTQPLTWTNLSLATGADTGSANTYNVNNSPVLVLASSFGDVMRGSLTGHVTTLTLDDQGTFFQPIFSVARADALVFNLHVSGGYAEITSTQSVAMSIDWSGVWNNCQGTIVANSVTATITFVNGLTGGFYDLEASSCTVLDTSAWAVGNASGSGTITLNGAFNTTSVDNILINLAASGTTNTAITIGGTSATPSVASAAAIVTLMGNSCTITTN